MSKEVIETGELWVDKSQTGNTKIGFTQTFLTKHLSECWHIIPTVGKVSKGGVLLSLETNDGLVPVVSPVEGEIVSFNADAINFPERLNETTDIAVVKVQEARKATATDYLKKEQKKSKQETDATPFAPPDWFRPADIRNNQVNQDTVMQWEQMQEQQRAIIEQERALIRNPFNQAEIRATPRRAATGTPRPNRTPPGVRTRNERW